MASPEEFDKSVADIENAQFDEVSDNIDDVRWMDYPALLIFWTLFVIVALQFITRYVFNNSLSWTEEIARFFLIFLGFVGSITCIRKGSHIYLEFFYRYLPTAMIKPVAVFCEVVTTAFFSFAGYLCIGLAQRTFSQRMISIDLPKGIIYWVVVVACFAMAVASAFNVVKVLRKPAADVAAEKLEPTQLAGH